MVEAIGRLIVASPGTLVRATSKRANPDEPYKCHGVMFQALPGNLGAVYIGLSGLSTSTGDDVLAVLPAPTATVLPSFSIALTFSPNALSLERFYLDADNADEGVLCTLLVT